MANKHMTMRGVPIDMHKLRAMNAEKPALGNASKNARGDLIDKKGVVLKTQEQINAEWEANRQANEESIRRVSIKDDLNTIIPNEAKKPVKQLLVDDQDFSPQTETKNTETTPHKTSKRKITESDT